MDRAKSFVSRLRNDPEWGRHVLEFVHAGALKRWQRRWRDGKHPTWIKPRETVGEGFRRALDNIPTDLEYDDVANYIDGIIDDYISDLMADTRPSPPRRVVRGAKRWRHGGSLMPIPDYNPQATALKTHIAKNGEQFAA